jgi:hypothetical protein
MKSSLYDGVFAPRTSPLIAIIKNTNLGIKCLLQMQIQRKIYKNGINKKTIKECMEKR